MLLDYQKKVIAQAIARAKEKGTEKEEITKLARGMKVSEAEILRALDEKKPATDNPVHEVSKDRTRIVWTPQMLQKLTALRDSGKGITEIAKEMNLEFKQVQNKLQRLPVVSQTTAEKILEDKPSDSVPIVSDSQDDDGVSNPYVYKGDMPPEDFERLQNMENDNQGAVDSTSENLEQPRGLDMLAAMLMLLKLLREELSGDVVRGYADNDERFTQIDFVVDGIKYSINLEAKKCTH
jgi:hypothetical protein